MVERNKQTRTLIFVCIGFITIFFVLLVISIVSVTSFSDSRSREMIKLDFANVANQAESLYDFNSSGVNRCIEEVKRLEKQLIVSDEDILDILKDNLMSLYGKENNVVLDIQCFKYTEINQNGKLYSAFNNNVEEISLPLIYAQGITLQGKLLESNVFEFEGKKVFAYYKNDTQSKCVMSMIVDSVQLAKYDLSFSIEDMMITLIKSNGLIISCSKEDYIGLNIYQMNNSNWNILVDWMPTIINNPSKVLQKSVTDHTFSYYDPTADRIILGMYHEPKSFTNYGYIILCVSAILLLVSGSGLSVLVINSQKKNNDLTEQLLISKMEKEEQAHYAESLCEIIEYRSQESGTHVKRLKKYTLCLASKMKELYPEYGLTMQMCETIALASTLHDIGKVAVSDAILNKPGRLTPEEFAIIQTHTTKGAEMIENLFKKKDDYYQMAYNIAYYHHERFNGRGYPQHLYGEEIPLEAQIVSVIDCFDALVNDRCYKKAVEVDEAYRMILNKECGEFNPKVLKAFVECKSEVLEIYHYYKELENNN